MPSFFSKGVRYIEELVLTAYNSPTQRTESQYIIQTIVDSTQKC